MSGGPAHAPIHTKGNLSRDSPETVSKGAGRRGRTRTRGNKKESDPCDSSFSLAAVWNDPRPRSHHHRAGLFGRRESPSDAVQRSLEPAARHTNQEPHRHLNENCPAKVKRRNIPIIIFFLFSSSLLRVRRRGAPRVMTAVRLTLPEKDHRRGVDERYSISSSSGAICFSKDRRG